MIDFKFEHLLGNEFVLLCPECGGSYLHHIKIENFEREEDAPNGIHTTIIRNDINIKYDSLDGNPSQRRHGLKIWFYCELCEAEPILTLSQHKGQTVFGWLE